MWTTRLRYWRSCLVTGRSVLGHCCRISTMPTAAHVPLKSGSSYLSWRRSKATGSYQMHSVQKKESNRSSAEQRLSSFADRTWALHPIPQSDDTYQGERIKDAARGSWKGGSTGSDEVDMDLEKGIWKKVSMEITRDPDRQG